MVKNVVGLFNDRILADSAIQDLLDAGFDRTNITAAPAVSEGRLLKEQVDQSGSFVGEGASYGVVAGALVGGVLGALIGAGYFLVPAGSPAAGVLIGLIVGSASGAAVGGILGALMGLGVPSSDPDVYGEGARRQGTLLVVKADEHQLDQVHAILSKDGAVNVEDRGFLYSEPTTAAVAQIYTKAQIEEDRVRYSATGEDYQRARAATLGQEAPPIQQTTGHAYADNPPGNVPPSGETTAIENTMGGARPRYNSLDETKDASNKS